MHTRSNNPETILQSYRRRQADFQTREAGNAEVVMLILPLWKQAREFAL
jgi:hypothetical protein